jgi:subtilisin family serine protease
MASPHVAGLGAYLLGLNGPQTPAQLGAAIKNLATTGMVSISGTGTSSTPNRLAFNGAATSVEEDGDTPEED